MRLKVPILGARVKKVASFLNIEINAAHRIHHGVGQTAVTVPPDQIPATPV